MKKIVSLLLILCIFSLTLCACVSEGEKETDPRDTLDATDSKPTTSLEDDTEKPSEKPTEKPTDAPVDDPNDPTDDPNDPTDDPNDPTDDPNKDPVEDPVVDPWQNDGFVPVVRFIASSDIHITSVDSTNAKRTKAVYEGIAAYFADPERNSGYAGLDAITIAGDITENGKPEEFEAAKAVLDAVIPAETKLVITMGNHDWNSQGNNSRASFESFFGPSMQDVKIGGYHFITVVDDKGWNYSQAVVNEAEELIQAAIADTGPDKPVFVIEHIGNTGTAAGTCIHAVQAGGNAIDTMNAMHEKYPNLVVFSGHSHFPANDTFSIHQEHFTSINTGSLKSVISILKVPDRYSQIQCHVVEIDAEGKLRVRHWDGYKNGFVGDTWYVDSYDPDEFIYNADRFSEGDIFFAEDAELKLSSLTSNAAMISIPPTPAESLPARSFKIVVKDAAGNIVNSFYYDTDYYLDDKVTPTSIELPDLKEDTEYTVEVYGVNSEFCSSRDNPEALLTEPLVASFKTYAAGEEARNGPVVDLDLSSDTPKNAVADGLNTTVYGAPVIEKEPTLGRNILLLNGFNEDIVTFGSYSSIAANLRDSMTFEIYFKVDRLPTTEERTFGIASSQQVGGFGLQVDPDSTATFWICNSATGSYEKLKVDIEVGVYHHLLASFDGSKCIVYLDGAKEASTDMPGVKLSDSKSAWYVYLGGDPDGSGGIAIPSECSIALFRLYTYGLTEEEARQAYFER